MPRAAPRAVPERARLESGGGAGFLGKRLEASSEETSLICRGRKRAAGRAGRGRGHHGAPYQHPANGCRGLLRAVLIDAGRR